MKQFLLFSVLVFLCIASFGQKTFKKQYTFNGGQYDDRSLLLYSNETTIIKGAAYFKKIDNYVIYTHLLDSNGKIVKTKIYSPDTSLKANFGSNRVILTSDNYLVFFTGDGYIFKSNTDGEIVWSKQLVSKNFTGWYDKVISEAEDGNYLLAANVSDDDSDKVQLLKINQNTGNIIWYKTFAVDFSRYNSWYPENIVTTKGEIYFEGAAGYGLSENTSPQYMVLNSKGNVKYFKQFPTEFGSSVYAKKLVARNNRVYAYCTINQSEQILIDITDNPLVRYGTSMIDGSVFATQKYLSGHKFLLPIQTDDLTIFKKNGSLVQYTSYNDKTLLLYDSLGRICNDYRIPKSDSTTTKKPFQFYDLKFAIKKDSLFLKDVAVYSYNGSSTTNILCEGKAPDNLFISKKKAITTKAQPSINFYPNPTANTLTIAGLNNKGKTTLQIINTNGNVLQEVTTASSTQTIDVHSLAAGAYLLRINNGEEIITKTFIKQ